MKLLVKQINSCMECPHRKVGAPYSTDGFDRMEDWTCQSMFSKKIAGAVEWHEEKKIPIPELYPLEDQK